MPVVTHDEAETARRLTVAHELFDAPVIGHHLFVGLGPAQIGKTDQHA